VLRALTSLTGRRWWRRFHLRLRWVGPRSRGSGHRGERHGDRAWALWRRHEL